MESSSSKRQKVLEGDQNQPLIDRLSGLPDSVLCYILSFLPTKVVVGTIILARRWRLLWTGVSNLHLHFDKTFQHKERCSDIINRVMMLHNAQNLKTLYLHSSHNCSEYQFETWMTTAIARKVQKIDLYFPSKVNLPAGLFTCRTLVDMKLQFLDSGFSASALRFHNLTKLELGSDWRFLLKFLQYADNLKDLVMLEVGKDLKCWKVPEQVPTCLLSHLTTVNVDKFGHGENEFAMLRYLLKNARVLKWMEIKSNSDDLHAKYCALQIISLYQRGSEACELAFR